MPSVSSPAPILDIEDGHIEAGTRLLIIGHGREGSSAARYLAHLSEKVTVADRAISSVHEESVMPGRTITLAPEDSSLLERADVVVVSPGVPETNHLLTSAQKAGIPITSATRIFFRRCPCPIVGITGSSGKSTTTALIGSILERDGRHVRVGGNIGTPMLDLVDDLDEGSIAVIELSSFQLQLLADSPHVAVVTNITPNHLDRHGDFRNYVQAKLNILSHQTSEDFAILNGSDEIVQDMASSTPAERHWFGWIRGDGYGSHVENGHIIARTAKGGFRVMEVTDVPLPGRHNVENVLAAVAATSALRVSEPPMREAIAHFQGLSHRLERVGEIAGVTYVDDSIATSPERVAVALASVQTPVVLIAGGRSKHLPWKPMLSLMDGRVHTVVLLGEASDEIGAAVAGQDWTHEISTIEAESLGEAVTQARTRAKPGDTILLSPGCTSYDMFANFEERGTAFKSLVMSLEEEHDGRHH